MPRLKDDTSTLLTDLTARLQKLVAIARKEGRENALSDVRALVGGQLPSGGTGRPRGRPKGSKNKVAAGGARRKSGGKRKNPWASMTPEQKRDRVRKMLAGRGLKPKGE